MSEYAHPQTSPPVGEHVDGRLARRPGPVSLAGRYGRVERLAPGHADGMWQALQAHNSIWTYSPSSGPFADATSFTALIETRAGQDRSLFLRHRRQSRPRRRHDVGEFESGLVAAWVGAVRSVVIGGIGSLLIALLWMRIFPDLAKIDRFEPADKEDKRAQCTF